MNRLLRAIAAGSLAFVVVVEADPANPSFDCKKATQEVERLICEDPDLAALDRKMADLYATLRSATLKDRQKVLKADQTAWIKERNSCQKTVTYTAV